MKEEPLTIYEKSAVDHKGDTAKFYIKKRPKSNFGFYSTTAHKSELVCLDVWKYSFYFLYLGKID